MNFVSIVGEDLLNGDGVRTSLWVTGCPHHCEGCHNPETWNMNYGEHFEPKHYLELRDKLLITKKLSVLGGEPLADYNYMEMQGILYNLKVDIPELTTWLWTGYTIPELKESGKEEILNYCDVIIEGRYEKDKPTTKRWRGSDNQRMWVRNIGYID